MDTIEKAAEYIKQGKVKIITNGERKIIIQVQDHIVIMEKKNGKTTDSCDCENHSHFCKENPRCSHKLAACVYIVMRKVKI